MHTRSAALAALIALAAGPAAAADISCRDRPVPSLVEGQAFAVDGDTLAFPGQPRVRLWGIQAPELRDKATRQETPAGMAARAALAERIAALAEPSVRCHPVKWDRWCRLVATCAAPAFGEPVRTDQDIAATMLLDGWAYGFMLDDPLRGREAEGVALARRYAALEAQARRARAGLWREWLRE